MTALKHAIPSLRYHVRSGYDVDAFRADLEQHRQFRVEQRDELTADMSAESDGALHEVTSTLQPAIRLRTGERATRRSARTKT